MHNFRNLNVRACHREAVVPRCKDVQKSTTMTRALGIGMAWTRACNALYSRADMCTAFVSRVTWCKQPQQEGNVRLGRGRATYG